MPNCEECGKEVPYPFDCSHCGKILCSKHRLPENHECITFTENKDREKNDEKKPTSEEGELYFIRDSAQETTTERLPKAYGSRKRSARTIAVFGIILVLGAAIAAYGSYNLGYNSGYDKGHYVGYANGNSTGFVDGNASGYNLGYVKGIIDGVGRGYNVRDPAYQEMLSFIASDKTDKNQYVVGSYVCWNFVADVKNNAFKSGYKCGDVYIEFPNSAHGIVCFNTTDRNLIFIEPQHDKIVTLTVGQSYSRSNGFEPTSYNDTLVRYSIVW